MSTQDKNEKSRAVTVENQLKQQQIEEISGSMNSIYDSLVVHAPHGRLPEEIFKERFLPTFAGEAPMVKDSAVIAEWIGVAGTAMNEVDIIDSKGNVLFTVPSIFDTNVLEITKRNAGESIADIYKEFNLRHNHIPIVADKYLAESLSGKLQEITKPVADGNPNQKRWTEILGRYGKAPSATQNQNTGNQQKSSTDLDDVVYD